MYDPTINQKKGKQRPISTKMILKGRPEEEKLCQETGLPGHIQKVTTTGIDDNYSQWPVKRTCRVLYSHCNVSQSEDKGGHVVTFWLCKSDKYKTRSANRH
jgi:hypothetical protein